MERMMPNRSYEVRICHEPEIWEWNAHYGDWYEMIYVMGGEAAVQADGWRYRLRKGDLLLMSPDCLRRYIALDVPVGMRTVIRIRERYLTALSDGGIDLRLCFARDDGGRCFCLHADEEQNPGLPGRITALEAECCSTAYGAPLLANGIFLQLMVELNRLAVRTAAHTEYDCIDPEYADGPGALTSAVLSTIISQYHTDLTLEMLASIHQADKNRLSANFRRDIGLPVLRCITSYRLMQTCRMLSDGYTAGEACMQTGFGDYAGFFRAFKTEYGISPRAFADSIQQAKE